MTVSIVTDSVSDIPKDIAEKLGITVVPLNLHFGTTTYLDNIDLTADEFYERLPDANPLPTTSQPSAGAFADTYRSVLENTSEILSLHASSKLSGTYNSAVLGREELLQELENNGNNNPLHTIEVIDTQWVSMAQGLLVIAAAEAAQDGMNLNDLKSLVNDLSSRTHITAVVDTLEYLARGGRLGKAGAFLGSILSLKPILKIEDGEVQPAGRVRSTAKARQQLRENVINAAPVERLALAYSTTRDVANEMAAELQQHVVSGEVILYQIGPVVGTHAGPGLIATAWIDTKG